MTWHLSISPSPQPPPALFCLYIYIYIYVYIYIYTLFSRRSRFSPCSTNPIHGANLEQQLATEQSVDKFTKYCYKTYYQIYVAICKTTSAPKLNIYKKRIYTPTPCEQNVSVAPREQKFVLVFVFSLVVSNSELRHNLTSIILILCVAGATTNKLAVYKARNTLILTRLKMYLIINML
jgi:hypothetical protein